MLAAIFVGALIVAGLCYKPTREAVSTILSLVGLFYLIFR